MKYSYHFNARNNYRGILTGFMALALLVLFSTAYGQQESTVTVSNDQELIDAIGDPAIKTIFIEEGYYSSVGKNIGPGTKAVKGGDPNGSRQLECIYVIQQSRTCFEPIPPETFESDTARAWTLDPNNCGCCPGNDEGVWSVTSGPGTVIFDEPNNDTTQFSVDMPGAYALRYSWPAPYNSYVETVYYFTESYTASLEASDTCALFTEVHFEYSSEAPSVSLTLEWTLNGQPYAGPAADPEGDTVDFILTVPVCGEYILEATLTPENCDPVTVSDTIQLWGDGAPIISGVGADTSVICPDEPVFSDPTASDPCGQDVTLTYETDTIPGDCPDRFTLVRTWIATNDCGNSDTATQVIEHYPNPDPEIIFPSRDIILEDTIIAGCDETVIIPFPEIETPCGPADVYYYRSDGGVWTDPFGTGETEVCYWGISPCGYSTDTLCTLVIREICDTIGQYCTHTQGFWGNAGGYYCNGMSTTELLDSLLDMGDLVVGSDGNVMIFQPGESACVIDLLPGGGPAKTISDTNTCDNHPGIQTKKGRIHNVLLAQTIALGLNLRLSDELGALVIYSDTLMTAPSSGCGEEGDTIAGEFTSSAIPESVYNVLSQNGTIDPTVADLYALANTALGGGDIGATTLSAIADAVAKINEGFVDCDFGYFVQPQFLQSMTLQGNSADREDASSIDVNIYPNPFSNNATIEFNAKSSGHAVVEVYTITGAKVATLFDGMVEEGHTYKHTFSGDPAMKQVTYICVIRTDDDTQIRRMLMMR